MRYVITGGTGFLGQTLADSLQAKGHSVVVASPRRPPDAMEWIEYDLRDPGTIANVLQTGADGVFHLAWSTNPTSAELDPVADFRVNLAGSVALFNSIALTKMVPVVFVSSGGTVYGEIGQIPAVEDMQPRPIGVYGLTKLSAETFANQLRARGRADIRIARVSNPYGTLQANSKLLGAASWYAKKVLLGEPLEIWGDGSVVRDFIHVHDAVDGITAVMALEGLSATSPAIFNIGTGIGCSIKELVDLITIVSDRRAIIVQKPGRDFDIAYNVLECSKLRDLSGWKPKYALAAGLRNLIDSFQRTKVPAP